MRAAAAIARAAADLGHELGVIGVPKTIDNDLHGTDRCPGYASAARYVAQSVRDLGMDVRGLPQPVSIFESMGRGAGWLAAASVLAKLDDAHAPHLVYLPERPFAIDDFLGDVDRVVRRLGWCVAVVSEGIRGADGRPVFESGDATQADALNRPLIGDVAAHLAAVASQRLKIRCRSEKPGLCGRASALHVAAQDLIDAEGVGRSAVHAAIDGQRGQMITLAPLTRIHHPLRCDRVPLESLAGERTIPSAWLGDSASTPVTSAFVIYAGRLVGALVDYTVPLRDRLPLLP
jgi:6-phosphofructokinase 1